MVEASEEQLVLIENFLTSLTDAIDWETAPEELKSQYAEATQVIGALIDSAKPQQADQMAPA